MELCPKCGLLCAERNHYDGHLHCYNKSCDYNEHEKNQNNDNKIIKKELNEDQNITFQINTLKIEPNKCYKL